LVNVQLQVVCSGAGQRVLGNYSEVISVGGDVDAWGKRLRKI